MLGFHALESFILTNLNLGDSLNNIILPSAPRLTYIRLGDPGITTLDLGFLSPIANTVTDFNLVDCYALTQVTNVNNLVLSHLFDPTCLVFCQGFPLLKPSDELPAELQFEPLRVVHEEDVDQGFSVHYDQLNIHALKLPAREWPSLNEKLLKMGLK